MAHPTASMNINRFSNSRYSELRDANDFPIGDYQRLPVLKLEYATEMLNSVVPELKNYVAAAKENCNKSSDKLILDESAAIYLYTMQSSFFSKLNEALQTENRNAVRPWLLFLKLLITALEKLEQSKSTVWRGIDGNVGSYFAKNSEETWWSINSCSKNRDLVRRHTGESGTILAINTLHGKDISAYSATKKEEKVVLMPGTYFHVRNEQTEWIDGLFVIHLDEECEQRSNDIVLFFFAGHNVQLDDQDFITACDEERIAEVSLNYVPINAQELLEQMSVRNPFVIVLLLDCSRDHWLLNQAKVRSLIDSSKACSAPDTVIIDETVHERNGVFTYHLLQRITKPGKNIRQLIVDVTNAVARDTQNAQIPYVTSALQGRSVYLVSPARHESNSNAWLTSMAELSIDSTIVDLPSIKAGTKFGGSGGDIFDDSSISGFTNSYYLHGMTIGSQISPLECCQFIYSCPGNSENILKSDFHGKSTLINTTDRLCLAENERISEVQILVDGEILYVNDIPKWVPLIRGIRFFTTNGRATQSIDHLPGELCTEKLDGYTVGYVTEFKWSPKQSTVSNDFEQIRHSFSAMFTSPDWMRLVTFRAHDRSHPRSNKIYTEDEKITNEIIKYGHIYDSSWITRVLNEDETVESVLCGHSERLAIAWGFVANPNASKLQMMKNLRICGDCHRSTKLIAAIRQCEIIVRDPNRIHHFYKNGVLV
ncbi:unnamed protein product [Rotaria magnacalcarata]|uniref:NAD(P)(+)--arginine ADP-ribosyltransferase n=2 Tax=Rotaria magnacalcarata TaxID=392030 RepID=A0A819PZP1_9BILA|nr:unnamed protein product [Rotaria magnacalcarata]